MDKQEKIDTIKRVLRYYLITRCVLLILIIFYKIFLPYFPSEFNTIAELFDNQHYLNIAKDGYTVYYQYAFFPLIPLLIRYLGRWGFIILNQILVVMSGYLIYLVDKNIFKNKDNDVPVIFWMISPISVFTCMYYTEGIFIFLTLMAYYLYKTEKNYVILGIVLGLCVATRSIGSMLFFAIFIVMMIKVFKKQEKFKNVIITYIPATIISCLYPIYLYFDTGNPLYFIDAQSYWLKVPTNIFMVFFDAIKYMDFKYSLFFDFNYLLTLCIFIYVYYLMIKNRKEKKYYDIFLYLIFSLISICSIIKAFYDPLASYYRYVFGCFPIYFILERNRCVFYMLLILSIIVATLFLSGTYFF